MRYYEIAPMCRPVATRGCPFDGLGCTGGDKCSINSTDPVVWQEAMNAKRYGPDFVCNKHQVTRASALRSPEPSGGGSC